MKLSSINKVDISLKQLLDIDTTSGSRDTVDKIRNGQVLTAYVTAERKDQFRFKDFASFLAAGTGISLSSLNGVTTISSTGGGSTTLASLTDVALSSPILGDVLMYDGTNWYNTPLTGGGDMLKATYDTDNDGVVDKAETVQITVRNSTGVTLTKGQIVYLSGATGNRPNAVLADASTEPTSSKTIGVVVANILNNSDGQVAVSGTLHDLDTSAFTAGDTLWLSETAGDAQANTPPAEPAHAVFIGFVARSHPNQGRVVLAIQNGYELTELHGVLTPSPSNNDVLRYNSTSGLWEDDSIATILGYTPIQLTSLSASSPLAYNNTTGVFSIQVANTSQSGYLSSTDWNTFNSKESALTFSSPLSRATNTISIPAATSSVNGYLTSTDWSTFNNKVPSTRTLTIDGTAYDLSADRSWTTGGSYNSYTMKANNTASSATPSNFTFKDLGDQALPTSPTWNGTAPSGTVNNRYRWFQIGNVVHYHFSFTYTTTGTSNSTLSFTHPSDMPVPAAFTGVPGAVAAPYFLYRVLSYAAATLNTQPPTGWYGGLKVTSTGPTVYGWAFSGTAVSILNWSVHGTYYT